MFIKCYIIIYVYQMLYNNICLSNVIIYISYLFDYKIESSLLIIMLLYRFVNSCLT